MLIALIEGNRLQNMVATCIYAGPRRTEACWLTWEDVDLERQIMQVRSKEIDGEFWCPKTKRNRVVPISGRLLAFLNTQRKSFPHSRWVFPSPEGQKWCSDNVTHRYAKLVRAAGLPWTLLDLRHTFGSHLAMKGVSLYKISKLMGNSPQVCERHYAALMPEEMHKEVEF